MAQIRFRIDTVQTAGADQPVQQCSTLAAVIATEEHVIFLSETDCTKRSFRCVIVHLRQTVITVITEGVPLIQYIAERFAQSGFFRQRAILLHHPSAVALLLLMYTSWIFRRAWAQHATSVSAPPSRSALNNLS